MPSADGVVDLDLLATLRARATLWAGGVVLGHGRYGTAEGGYGRYARIVGAEVGSEAARRLAMLGHVVIEPGLSAGELDRIQRRCGFEFADDHRAFLATGLPVGTRWPDWRHGTDDDLRALLDRPVEGVLFDVGRNDFWCRSWGPRPDDPDVALEVARSRLSLVPRMLPLYSHRYLPAGRDMSGHPVLSIHQTDVICYGVDLIDFIHREFGGASPERHRTPQVMVEFWKDLR